jgi:hypothetical protein
MSRILSALLFAPALAAAQTGAAGQVERDVARRVAGRVADAVEEAYVIPDTGRMIADLIRAQVKAGAYDAPTGASQFADHLSADLKKVNGDLHLYVTFTGGQSAAQSGPQMMMRRPGDQPPPDQLLAGRRANHDVRSVERLAGNVGYLSVGMLSARIDEALRVIDAAMSFLERTDAMIIDLRQTRGGDPRMSDYLASYFFGPDSVRTLNTYMRSMNQTMERWTVPVNGTRRPNIPVFVLVGPGTASGTEDFAFILKQTGRGILVGERTAGAGRPNRISPVGDGFSVSISGGRTYDPRTGAEWERVGIQPNIAANTADALTVAHAEALKRLAETTADSSWRTTLTWAREGVLARAHPRQLSVATLKKLIGSYDARVITFDQGKLWYQREANRPREELAAIDDHTFALGEASKIEFLQQRDGVTGMRVFSTPELIALMPRTR